MERRGISKANERLSSMDQEEKRRLMETDSVDLSADGKKLVIIDQTLLPGEFRLLELRDRRDIIEAIKVLRVRGAPVV